MNLFKAKVYCMYCDHYRHARSNYRRNVAEEAEGFSEKGTCLHKKNCVYNTIGYVIQINKIVNNDNNRCRYFKEADGGCD